MKLKFRLMLPKELSKVSDLWGEMIAEIRPNNTPDKSVFIEEMSRAIRNNRCDIFVIEVSETGKLIGFSDFYYATDPTRNILVASCQYVFIQPEFRKHRLMSTMLQCFKNRAKLLGVSVLRGYCDDSTRPLWEKIGFSFGSYIMELAI